MAAPLEGSLVSRKLNWTPTAHCRCPLCTAPKVGIHHVDYLLDRRVMLGHGDMNSQFEPYLSQDYIWWGVEVGLLVLLSADI